MSPGLKSTNRYGPGADRLQVGWRSRVTCLRCSRRDVLRDDHAIGADEGVGPERRRLVEDHPDGVVVELLDLDIPVAADRDGRGVRIFRVFPGKDDVVGSERLAVMPFNALLQLPDHRQAVFLQPVIVLAWDLGRQNRDQVAFAVPAGQRLIKYAGTFLVLGAGSEMRVQQRDGLPVQ